MTLLPFLCLLVANSWLQIGVRQYALRRFAGHQPHRPNGLRCILSTQAPRLLTIGDCSQYVNPLTLNMSGYHSGRFRPTAVRVAGSDLNGWGPPTPLRFLHDLETKWLKRYNQESKRFTHKYLFSLDLVLPIPHPNNRGRHNP